MKTSPWKRTAGLLIALVCGLVPARAGHVYGTLVEAKQPASGVKIEVVTRTGGKTYTATTAADGSYRLFVRESGKCRFIAHYKGKAPAIEIYSYDEPVRYNLELVRTKDDYRIVKR